MLSGSSVLFLATAIPYLLSMAIVLAPAPHQSSLIHATMVPWWLLGQVQRCGWAHVSSHLIASAINRPWSLTFMLARFFLVCVLAWVPRPFSLQLSVAPLMPPAKVGWRLRLYCATLTHHSHHLLLPYWKTALHCIIVSFRDCRVETCQIIHRSSSKYTLVWYDLL